MKFITIFIINIIFISGCNTHNDYLKYDNVNKISNLSTNGTFKIIRNANYIQWNEEYAVSSFHLFKEIKKYNSSLKYDYACLDCDLVFFKNKSKQTNKSEWRQPKKGEKITHFGHDDNGYIVSKEGYFTGNVIEDSRYKNFWLLISTAQIKKGYSGGAVYSEDGKIVGMSKGFTLKPTYQSLFIDFDTINKEWINFKNKKIKAI